MFNSLYTFPALPPSEYHSRSHRLYSGFNRVSHRVVSRVFHGCSVVVDVVPGPPTTLRRPPLRGDRPPYQAGPAAASPPFRKGSALPGPARRRRKGRGPPSASGGGGPRPQRKPASIRLLTVELLIASFCVNSPAAEGDLASPFVLEGRYRPIKPAASLGRTAASRRLLMSWGPNFPN